MKRIVVLISGSGIVYSNIISSIITYPFFFSRNKPPSPHKRPQHTPPPILRNHASPLKPQSSLRPNPRIPRRTPNPHILSRPPALPIQKPNKIKIRLRCRNSPHRLGRIPRFSGVGGVDAHPQRGFPGFNGSCTGYKPSPCAPGCI